MESKKRVKTASFSLLHQSLVGIDDIKDVQADLAQIFEIAGEFQDNKSYKNVCKDRIVALAFLEPSTRTMCSFSAAAQRLGAGVITTNATDSSVTKGETLSDTIKCLASYADLIVLRHPKLGAAKEASQATLKPILNAGDGTGEHPTQALLDLYTILRETKDRHFDEHHPLNVTFLGDAKNGRTVHSLSKLLSRYLGNKVHLRYVTPSAVDLKMPKAIVDALRATTGVRQSEHGELSSEIIESTDVLYVTRVQKERFSDVADYDQAMKASFRVNAEVVNQMKDTALIMHPLPRVDEIHTDVDDNLRCAYFKQMENGMYVRMALIALVLGDV